MSVRRIGDCFPYIKNGANIKQGRGKGGYPITRIETLSQSVFNRDRLGYADIFDLDPYLDRILEDGDILMSHINSIPYLGRSVMYESHPGERIIHGMNLLRLKANRGLIEPGYATIYFNTEFFKARLMTIVKKAVNQASYSINDLKKLSIPCPSLDQQKEIVAVFEAVNRKRHLLNRMDESLGELVKSRFVEMFGEVRSNSMGWRQEPLGNHIDVLAGYPFDSSKYVDAGINICGGLIIMPGYVKWEECKKWPSVDGYEAYLLDSDDIVMALDRPWITEGFKIAQVTAEDLPALLIQRTARIRSLDMNQRFTRQLLEHDAFRKHCTVTGSLVPHISHKDIKSYKVICPPIELQNEFATFVEQVDKSKAAVQKAIDKLETLKASLMQEYFG